MEKLKYSEETFREMYEALKALFNWWHQRYDSFYPDEWSNAVKALAKAEGN